MISIAEVYCFRKIVRTPLTHLLTLSSRTSSTSISEAPELSDNDINLLSMANAKPYSAIPGPRPLPVLRNLVALKKNLFTFNQYLEDCSNMYGKIFKLEAPGGNRFVYITCPDAWESVLRVEGKYPKRESVLSLNLQWIMNKLDFPIPIIFKIGEDWKKSRSATKNQIKPSNVQTYTAGLSEVFDSFINHIQSTKDGKGRVSDINGPLKRLFVSSMAKIVFNADLCVFDKPTKESEEFIAAISLLLDSLLKLLYEPPWFKLYPNKVYRDLKKGFAVVKNTGVKHANEVLRRIESGVEKPVQGLLEQWMREGKMSEKEAVMASASMFAAGVDTTSTQAAWMLHFIAKNPHAQDKLYSEIKSVLGQRTQPTTEDFAKMSYLKGCMMESIRMQPVAAMIGRVLETDIKLMGYTIPAETNIVYVNSVVAKKEEYFLNPERFDPERWVRDKPNPFTVLNFGMGPRNCYGKRFAELQFKLLLCKIIQKFTLETDKEIVDDSFTTITRPAGDLPIYFQSRY